MVSATLLVLPVTLAAEAAPPLIDIDRTALLQLAIFLTMWVVLSQLVFGPFLKMRAQRTLAIDGARAEAVKMQAEAQKIVATYDASLAQTRTKGNAERARLAGEAIKEEQLLLAQARTASTAALDAARANITAQTDTARRNLAAQAGTLARDMAQKILGRAVQS